LSENLKELQLSRTEPASAARADDPAIVAVMIAEVAA
jgi:hypothetical protein